MIMIQVLRLLFAAHGATVALSPSNLRERLPGGLVSTIKVGRASGGVVARLAPASEAGRGSTVADVVLVRHRLFAGGAPPEPIRYPGVVAYLVPLRESPFSIPAIGSGPVASEAVERQTIGERAVAAEPRVFLRLPAP